MQRFWIIAVVLVGSALSLAVRAQEPPLQAPPLPAPSRINDRPPLPQIIELPNLPIEPAQPAQPARPEQSLPTEQLAPTPPQTAESASNPCEVEWKKVPPVRNPFPRLGWFQIPREGCGYYSLLDLVRDNPREKPPKYPYPPTSGCAGSFFDADYRYLDDPANSQHDWLDFLKRRHFGDEVMVTTGGEFRYRLMDEQASRLTNADNNYNLIRTRVYGDFYYRDRLRAYIEFIEAHAFHESLAPLPIDRNFADILNLFVDVKLFEQLGVPGYLRVGRQELLYGSERLISPLDWANTRRTFQGIKLFWPSEKWDLDMFWVKPVVISAAELDSWDPKQDFFGLWATYKPRKGTTRDFYVLNFANYRPVATGSNQQVGGFDVTTFGTRWAGDHDGRILYDGEAMIQTGIRANTQMAAYAYATGLGYRFKDCWLNPTFWVYDEYASGDPNPGAGLSRTFNQLFPFGHYYFGLQDFVGRQNINDLNAQVSINPTRWISMLFQYHHFTLAERRDGLYNPAGVRIRQDPTGASGRYVGDEFDIVTNVHFSQHADVWFGVGYFATGPFLQNTGGPVRTPETFYLQYSYKW
jgi:Alginate export